MSNKNYGPFTKSLHQPGDGNCYLWFEWFLITNSYPHQTIELIFLDHFLSSVDLLNVLCTLWAQTTIFFVLSDRSASKVKFFDLSFEFTLINFITTRGISWQKIILRWIISMRTLKMFSFITRNITWSFKEDLLKQWIDRKYTVFHIDTFWCVITAEVLTFMEVTIPSKEVLDKNVTKFEFLRYDKIVKSNFPIAEIKLRR